MLIIALTGGIGSGKTTVSEIFKSKNIPVIAVTANAMQRDIDNAYQAGFTDYITKPIDLHKLFAAIRKVLN